MSVQLSPRQGSETLDPRSLGRFLTWSAPPLASSPACLLCRGRRGEHGVELEFRFLLTATKLLRGTAGAAAHPAELGACPQNLRPILPENICILLL